MAARPRKGRDVGAMSFEEALAELERIVDRLESGEAKLEDSIADYERGALLKTHCEERLRAARQRIDRITLGADGVVGTEPVDDGGDGPPDEEMPF